MLTGLFNVEPFQMFIFKKKKKEPVVLEASDSELPNEDDSLHEAKVYSRLRTETGTFHYYRLDDVSREIRYHHRKGKVTR